MKVVCFVRLVTYVRAEMNSQPATFNPMFFNFLIPFWQILGYYLKFSHNHFLLHPFQFIIHPNNPSYLL